MLFGGAPKPAATQADPHNEPIEKARIDSSPCGDRHGYMQSKYMSIGSKGNWRQVQVSRQAGRKLYEQVV